MQNNRQLLYQICPFRLRGGSCGEFRGSTNSQLNLCVCRHLLWAGASTNVSAAPIGGGAIRVTSALQVYKILQCVCVCVYSALLYKHYALQH